MKAKKCVAVCVCVCFIWGLYVTPIFAECGKSGWIKDKITGCKVWNPCPQDNESIRWTGECINGIATGEGKLNWYEDGELMVIDFGTLVSGKLDGKVQSQYYKNGECTKVVVGYWKNDKKDGKFEYGRVGTK